MTDKDLNAPPSWYDESKLTRIKFEFDETGWAIDLGNGLYRIVNHTVRGMCDPKNGATWGDVVRVKPKGGLKIIKRYEHRPKP